MSRVPQEPRKQLTIEQLAAESGMSVRNIRAHQARGLVDPPEVRLRVGYYGPEHLVQLRKIRELQNQGFNLNGIKRLLEGSDGSAEQLLRFRHALAAPEPAETLTLAELGRRFRVSAADAPGVHAKAQVLGVLRPLGDDRYEVPSPSLLAVAEEAIGEGVSLHGALAILEEIGRHCDAVAASFVKLFLAEVWSPFQEADMPAEHWPRIEQAIEHLRPVASRALTAIFQQRLTAQVEAEFAQITKRISEMS